MPIATVGYIVENISGAEKESRHLCILRIGNESRTDQITEIHAEP